MLLNSNSEADHLDMDATGMLGDVSRTSSPRNNNYSGYSARSTPKLASFDTAPRKTPIKNRLQKQSHFRDHKSLMRHMVKISRSVKTMANENLHHLTYSGQHSDEEGDEAFGG